MRRMAMAATGTGAGAFGSGWRVRSPDAQNQRLGAALLALC
jgi:hypothetical protein